MKALAAFLEGGVVVLPRELFLHDANSLAKFFFVVLYVLLYLVPQAFCDLLVADACNILQVSLFLARNDLLICGVVVNEFAEFHPQPDRAKRYASNTIIVFGRDYRRQIASHGMTADCEPLIRKVALNKLVDALNVPVRTIQVGLHCL